MKWYFKVWKRYANFRGRARRKEFWFFTLFNSLIMFILMLGMAAFFIFLQFIPAIIIAILIGCYNLAILVPSLAVCVRRLHDTGKSGWNYFMGCIPFAGGIILLIWFFKDSQYGENKWGKNPKELDNDAPDITLSPSNYFPRLLYRSGYDSLTYDIIGHRTKIGRDRNNDLVINHPTVSRSHAEIVSTNAGYEIIDLGSTNKVIVNGQFFQRKILRNGDIIGLGEVVVNFNV